MGQWVPIPLPTQSAEARSSFASKQRLVNLYPEIASEGDKGPFTLYSIPGLKHWRTVGSGSIRGLHTMLGYLWVVSGTELYYVTRDKVFTLAGTVPGTGAVHMTDNGKHLLIATASKLYYANTAGVTEITDPDDGGDFVARGLDFQDGYGLVLEADTIGKLFWTDVDDMTTIGALSFNTADAQSDKSAGMISDHREVWIFKDKSIEVFVNTGNPNTTFARAGAGAFIERGCFAEHSIAKAENVIYWLGDDWAVYRAPGYQHQRISTPWIEERIRAQPDKSTARAFTYSQGGQNYYVLTFDKLTAVYSITTGRWHERESRNEGRWRVSCYAFFDGKHIVGDFENANVYEVDLDTHDDNGTGRTCEMVTPIMQVGGRRAVVDEIYLDIETGTGRDWADWDGTQVDGTDWLDAEDPEIWLDYSDDGGNIWSEERIGNAGKIGERRHRVNWTRLGSFRQPGRMFRFRFPDRAKVAVMGAYARVEVWD